MRTTRYVSGLLLALALLAPGFAQAKPNFSGTWVLIKDKSFNNGAEFDQTMTLLQEGDTIKVDAKQKTPRGEVVIVEEYVLDGKEAAFTPTGQPTFKGKRKSSWLPNGRVFVEDEITNDGKPVRQISRKMALSADGKTLTVDLFIDDARMSYEVKRIYSKAE